MVTLEFQKKDYELTISILNILAKQFEKYLQSLKCIDIQEYKNYINNLNVEKESEYIILFQNACKVYNHVATFPSDDGIDILKNVFCLQSEYLTWITDFKKIITEIERINLNDNIYVSYSYVVYVYYLLYMPSKIRNKLLDAFKLYSIYDGHKKNKIEILIFKLNQNIKYRKKGGNTTIKNQCEKLYQDLLSLFKMFGLEEFTDTNAENIIKKEASGDVEKLYLLSIIQNCFEIKTISKSQKLRLFFPLYKELLKEYQWMNEEDFYKSIKEDKNKNIVGLYGNSYHRYQEITMSNFLRKT
jgi:hypothetical protein